MDVRVGAQRRLGTRELMLANVVLEKTLENPLDCQEIKSVNPKGNQHWIVIGRTDAEAEVPIFWPHDAKSWLTGRDLDAGKDWGQEEKKATEDEMVGWHHRLNGHEFEQTWRTMKLGVLQSMGSQRVRPNLVSEQQQWQRAPRFAFPYWWKKL